MESFMGKKRRKKSGRALKPRVNVPACVRVCVCVVRALPLLTRVCCGHSISQLLKRIDAAVLFEFNSQHLLFQITSTPPEGSYGSLSFRAWLGQMTRFLTAHSDIKHALTVWVFWLDCQAFPKQVKVSEGSFFLCEPCLVSVETRSVSPTVTKVERLK